MKINVPKIIKQIFKYGMVGSLNTIITISTIFIFMKLFKVSYILSNAAGYILGFINSFFLNKTWTFKSKGSMGKESLFFMFIFLISYSMQLVFLIFLKEKMLIKAEYAQVIAMGLSALINFTGNKFVTFKA